jgi:hypothetical protein
MKARRMVIPVLVSGAFAASAAPAGAAAGGGGQSEANASCVGLFASNEAGPGFGQGISEEAQASSPFGRNVVSGFAHERFPCP